MSGAQLSVVDTKPTAGLPVMIKVADIRRQKGQPREEFDEAELRDLAQSILENGLITPISVRIIDRQKEPDSEHLYELGNGERRWRAHQLAGLEEIKAFFEFPKDADQQHLWSLIANLHAAPHTHMEISNALHRQKEAGMPVRELADKLGKTEPYIYQYLSLQKLSDGLKQLMSPRADDDKRLRMSVAIILVRISGHRMQETIYGEVLKYPLKYRRAKTLQKVNAVLGKKKSNGHYRGEKQKERKTRPTEGARSIYAFARNLPLDVERLLDLPNPAFQSFVVSRPSDDLDGIIAGLKQGQKDLGELIDAIERSRRKLRFA